MDALLERGLIWPKLIGFRNVSKPWHEPRLVPTEGEFVEDFLYHWIKEEVSVFDSSACLCVCDPHESCTTILAPYVGFTCQ